MLGKCGGLTTMLELVGYSPQFQHCSSLSSSLNRTVEFGIASCSRLLQSPSKSRIALPAISRYPITSSVSRKPPRRPLILRSNPFLACASRSLRDSQLGFVGRSPNPPPVSQFSSMAPSKGPSSPSRSTQLEIVTGEGELRGEILHNMPSLREKYRAFPIVASNRHVETIFASFYRRRPRMRLRRECLRMVDGGTAALDWPVAVLGGDSHAEIWKQELPPEAPIVLLLPGLTGGSHDSYVRHFIIAVRQRGWRPVVFNSRGCSDSPVTTPKFYSASFTEDLRQVVRHLAYQFQEARIYAVGWSLGGNILVRYIGQEGEDCLLAAAVSLCNPFDLVVADEDFRRGFNNVYDKSLARGLRTILRKHLDLFEGIEGDYNISKAANAKTVRDFDDGLTRVSFGYKSVDEYYADASSSRSIEHVRIPLLCIQAANDPIAPSRGIPRAAIKENRNCLLVVTPKGGHLGWVAGKSAPFGNPWTDPVVVEYLEAVESLYKQRKSTHKHVHEDQTEIVCSS